MILTEVIGVIGGVLILVAFVCNSLGRWKAESLRYEFFSMVGAGLLVYYTLEKNAYANVVLNSIWALVAAYSLVNLIQRRKIRKKRKSLKK